jgi:hypothetical protein
MNPEPPVTTILLIASSSFRLAKCECHRYMQARACLFRGLEEQAAEKVDLALDFGWRSASALR